MSDLYRPPRPAALWSVAALIRAAWRGDGDLLNILPAAAYRMAAGNLGFSRRSIILFNRPDLVSEILTDPDELFPKSDLMINALEPLIGDSIFVTYGETWRQQRKMIEPAFSQMRISHGFAHMQAAVTRFEAVLDARADHGETFSLDQAMSELTSDIICRTVFSMPFPQEMARKIHADFAIFEGSVAQVEIRRLITEPAWSKPRQSPAVLEACQRIRASLGEMIDTHLGENEGRYNDIASAVIAARDEETGKRLTRDELIDQLGVFFLAGHKTTASVLTWLFFILSSQPGLVATMRKEIDDTSEDREISFDDTRRMPFLRSVFRETLRLYPPVTFLPRVAIKTGKVGGRRVRRGALVMISPWTTHRHRDIWKDPDCFDPERFMPAREKSIPRGAYIPFGLGPHICVGAAFAMAESALIIASLVRRYNFQVLEPAKVRPVARLTTHPASQIMVRISRHGA